VNETDSPLKILITDPHLDGGGQVRYIANLGRELVGQGHGVTVGCRPGSVLVAKATEAGCHVLDEFPFGGGLRFGAWRRDLRVLREFIRRESPDIVHVNLSQDHWSCAVGNRLQSFPVCLVRTRHNTYAVKETLANRVLNRRWTDYQIVVCDVVRRELAGQRTFDAQRMCSIHNGVDAEAFAPDAEGRESARREFGFDESDLVLGIAARLVPAKGHEYLFRAVAELRAAIPNLKVLVLGQGELQEELVKLVTELSLDSQVLFAGYREDMPRCTQAFDIGVQPSVDCDTSSFSLKEQMAAEKAVIASDYGGLTEIVRDGTEGRIVPAGIVEPLADAIRKTVENPSLRAEMGKAGRRRVLDEFTVEVFAKRTVEAYRTAIEIHRQRREGNAQSP
jgi:glycosyltransferase involved in cell wall biosynthesis